MSARRSVHMILRQEQQRHSYGAKLVPVGEEVVIQSRDVGIGERMS